MPNKSEHGNRKSFVVAVVTGQEGRRKSDRRKSGGEERRSGKDSAGRGAQEREVVSKITSQSSFYDTTAGRNDR